MHGPKQPLITHLTFSLTKAHNGNILSWFTAAVITRVGPIRHHYTLKKIKRQKHFTTQGSIAKKKIKMCIERLFGIPLSLTRTVLASLSEHELN